jgi:MFS family permease
MSVSGGEGTGRRGTVLAVAGLMLALFLVALDQTVVGTALPKIIADLDGFEHYAWVTTAYLLASTAMIPVIGKLGDIYGSGLSSPGWRCSSWRARSAGPLGG